MEQAASVAAWRTLILTCCGSHTNNFIISSVFPSMTLTPNQIPSSPPWACFYLNLLRISVESMPEFSAKVLGMVSSALANPLITNYVLPGMFLRYSLKYLDNSISMAPPPATTACDLTALLTIMIASFKDLSVSSRYWEAPPLRTIVDVLVWWHSVNMLNLSVPSWISSNLPQVPRTSSVRPNTVVCKIAPVALPTLYKSSFWTLPAQKMSLSAKYWVARSPIGMLESTILAPELTILSNFS